MNRCIQCKLALYSAVKHDLSMQIPEGDGALALHVMPRYMLHNNLQVGVQYKQQVRWRICVNVHVPVQDLFSHCLWLLCCRNTRDVQ